MAIYLRLDPSSTCQNGDVRLVAGQAPDQGRVEYCLGGIWGTICGDNSWDNREAQVICRQLGYENASGE